MQQIDFASNRVCPGGCPGRRNNETSMGARRRCPSIDWIFSVFLLFNNVAENFKGQMIFEIFVRVKKNVFFLQLFRRLIMTRI